MTTKENHKSLTLQHLSSFTEITQIPITLFNSDHTIQWGTDPHKKFCTLFSHYQDPSSSCRLNLRSAAAFSHNLVDPYIFTCPIGLVNFALPVSFSETDFGYLIAGPIVMGSIRESTISSILESYSSEYDQVSQILFSLVRQKVYSPDEIAHLANLFYCCTTVPSLPSTDSNPNATQVGVLKKQIEDRDIDGIPKISYPFELENQLLVQTKNGDFLNAKITLKELLHQIALIEAGDIEAIKIKLIGIYGVLARNIANQDPLFHDTMDLDVEDIYKLDQVANYDQLLKVATSFIEFCCSKAFIYSYSGDSETLKQALHIIHMKYTERLTLQDIASSVHVNPAYLSTLFKKEMSISYTDYINRLRIDRAKILLFKTDLSVIEIATQCGFADQSYFTKVFKRIESCTPKSYRASKDLLS